MGHLVLLLHLTSLCGRPLCHLPRETSADCGRVASRTGRSSLRQPCPPTFETLPASISNRMRRPRQSTTKWHSHLFWSVLAQCVPRTPSRPRGESVLERVGGTFSLLCKLLGNGAGNQPAEHVPDNNAPDASVPLLQCSHPPNSHSRQNVFLDSTTCEESGHIPQQRGPGGTVQQNIQMLRGHARWSSCRLSENSATNSETRDQCPNREGLWGPPLPRMGQVVLSHMAVVSSTSSLFLVPKNLLQEPGV